MQEEEEAWRAKERLNPAPGPSDNNRKPNENPGNGTDESEDDDDDITPGCYVLDINNDALRFKRIWIRAEFIRIFNYLVEYYDRITSQDSENTAPSAVITGQPGIGKSVWLYYALRRCLAERRPVILRYRRKPLLFVEDGVFWMRADFEFACYKRVLWALIDLDDCPTASGIPDEFVTRHTPFFVICTMSPAEENWSRVEKTTFNAVIVMNPWSRGEFHRVAKLHSNTLDSKFIDDIYDRFGPTPRLCLQTAFDSEALAIHENETRIALKRLTLQNPQDLISKLEMLSMDDFSHKLCLVKHHIRSRMAIQMRTLRSLGTLQQVNLYRTFACTPSRGMAGHIFESFCQRHFQRRILIDYVPMILLTGQRKCQWHTSHHPVEDQKSEKSRQNALRRTVTLDIYPSNICEYSDQDVQGLTLTPDVYYIPSTQNAVAIDSFIYHGKYLYLLHFTNSQEHKINLNFVSRFTQYANFPPRSKWRLIFIVPDDVEVLTCPYSRSPELQTFKLFSSKVKMEDYLKVACFKEQEEKEESPHKKQKLTKAPAEVLY